MSILDSLVTNRTSSDVAAKNSNGTYNYTDLNRVNAAVDYIAEMLRSYGYAVNIESAKTWEENDIPFASEMNVYISRVRGIAVIDFSKSPPALPPDMEMLTYSSANNIEQFLKQLGTIAEKIPRTWYYSGEVYGGEVNL